MTVKEQETEQVPEQDETLVDLTQRSIKSILMVGPRGVRGFFGWTFFDPANLVCVGFLLAAATLTIVSMRDRGAVDWYMPIGLYICLAAFLRGYFFSYFTSMNRNMLPVEMPNCLVQRLFHDESSDFPSRFGSQILMKSTHKKIGPFRHPLDVFSNQSCWLINPLYPLHGISSQVFCTVFP